MKKNLYGKQTEAAIDNFPFEYPRAHIEFVHAMAKIKKAAAAANLKAGKLTAEKSEKIQSACDEILAGKHDGQFVVKGLHGGAGTSVNMNVNEVIGTISDTHPNDDVNASQSTNDVNPSALKIASLILTARLLLKIDGLISALDEKSSEWKDVIKLARTHMQDAVPTTLGAEFGSYRDTVNRDRQRITEALKYLYELNLGGTAIGNSINAPETYRNELYRELANTTGISGLRPLGNLMSGTSSDTDFCGLSASVTLLCLDLSKIATDLRFMSSGPKGGIGEISFAELQPGSSIMPGKVNPVMGELINQVYYQVSGRNLTIHHAAESSCLELGVMLPSIADALLTILKITETAIGVFTEKGIRKIKANRERCKEHLERSTAYSTLLTPKLGYDTVSKIVKESVSTGKLLRELVIGKRLLTDKEFDELTIIKSI